MKNRLSFWLLLLTQLSLTTATLANPSSELSKLAQDPLAAPSPAVSENLPNQALSTPTYFDLEFEGSEATRFGSFGVRLPIWQNNNSLFFSDLGVNIADDGTLGGNFGIAYRRLLSSDPQGNNAWVAGVYSFYDRSRSTNENWYNQASFGAELLSDRFEFRVNGYLPEGGSHVVGRRTLEESFLTGTQLNTRRYNLEASETALPGFDLELGYRQPVNQSMAVGLYGGYFWRSASDFPTIQGPSGRIQYEWNDAFGLLGSRFEAGAQIESDEIRSTNTVGFLRFAVPLGNRATSISRRQVDRLMALPINRDPQVLTLAQNINRAPGSKLGPTIKSVEEEVINRPGTTDPLRLFFVTQNGSPLALGTQQDPMTIAQAESKAAIGDIVFLLNDTGKIDVSPTTDGTFNLRDNQQLLGIGDAASRPVTLPNGLIFNVISSTGRPTLFRPSGANVVTLASNNTIDGITISGGDTGIFGLNNSNATIRDTIIQDTGSHGISVNWKDLAVINTRIQNTGGSGIRMRNIQGTFNFDNVTIANTVGPAFDLDNSNATVTFTGNITNSQGKTVAIANTTGGSITFSSGAIAQTANGGISINNANSPVTINSQINTTGGNGIDIQGGTGNITIANTQLSNTTGTAINVANRTGGNVELGVVNIANSSGVGINLNNNSGNFTVTGDTTIKTTTGTGVLVQNQGASGTTTFNQLNIQNSGSTGVELNNNAGTFQVTGNTTISNASGASLKINGGSANSNFGSTTINNRGAEGILVSGTSGVTNFGNTTIAAKGTSGTTAGISISNTTNDINFGTTTVADSGGDGIAINNVSTSSNNPAVRFGSTTVGSATNIVGNGISLSNVGTGGISFDRAVVGNGGSVTTGIAISGNNTGAIAFNNTTGNSSITGTTGDAFTLTGNSGTITFKGDITQNANAALVNVTNHTGGAVTFQDGTLSATNGTGLQFSNADGTYNFNGTTTINGGEAGVDIVAVSDGNFNFSANTTITNNSAINTALTIDGGSATVNFNGNITNNNGRTVAIANTSGGSVTLVGGQINQTAGSGIAINNVNANVTINSPVTITGGSGIDIQGGSGTISIANAQLSNTTGTAINATNRTGGNVTFGTLNIANSGGTGINLDNNAGSFTVTGNTTINNSTGAGIDIGNNSGSVNFSAVAISNTLGAGIDLSNSNTNASFGDITITSTGSDGINAAGSTSNLAFANLNITNPNPLTNTSQQGINLTGAASNVTINQLNINGASTAVNLTNATGKFIVGADATANAGTIQNAIVGFDLSGANMNNNAADQPQLRFRNGILTAGVPVDTVGLSFNANNIYDFTNTIITKDSALSTQTGFGGQFYYISSNGTNAAGVGTTSNYANVTAAENNTNTGDILVVVNATGAGDTISAASSNSNNTLVLKDNQQLIGFANGNASVNFNPQASALGILGNFIYNITDPTGNGATNLTTTGESVVTLANNNFLSGLVIQGGTDAVSGNGINNVTIQNTTIANNTNSGINLNNVTGTVAVTNSAITNSGATAVSLSNSAANTSFTNNTITQTGGRLIDINGTSGTITFTGGTLTNNNGTGIQVQNTTGGSVSINNAIINNASTAFTATNNTGTVSLTGTNITTASGGTGVNINGGSGAITLTGTLTQSNGGTAVNINGGSRIVDLTGLNITNQNSTASNAIAVQNTSGNVNFGTVNISGFGGSTGVNLNTNTATIGFNDLDIGTTAGTALTISGSGGTYNFTDLDISGTGAGIVASGTGALNITGAGNTISAGGTGLSLSDRTLNATFDNVSSTNGVNNITLTNIGGTLNIANGALSGSTGTAFNVDGGNANITYGGTINNTAGRAVAIQNTTGGSVTLNGSSITDSGAGILINNTASNVTINNASISGSDGVDINGAVTGNVTINNSTVNNVTGDAFSIAGSGAGVTGIIDLNNLAINKNNAGFAVSIGGMNGSTVDFDAASVFNITGGSGINIANNTTGTNNITFNNTITLGTTASRLTTTPLTMTNNSAGTTATFANLNIATQNDEGINISGAGNGNLTINNGSVDTIGESAIALANTTANITLSSVNAANTGVGNDGLDFDNVAGSFTVTGSTTINGTGGTASGIDINGGSANYTFGSVNISNTGGSGISLQNLGGTSIFGATTVSNASGLSINIGNSTGNITFADTNIINPGSSGMFIIGGTSNIAFGNTTIGASPGRGIGIADMTGGSVTFASTTITNPAFEGIYVLNNSSNITINGGSITNPSGTAFAVSGGNSNITYSGSITKNNTGRVVDIVNTTGGVVNFTGTVSSTATDSTGVNINNANGNVSFANLTLGNDSNRLTNQAITISGGTGTYSLGNVSIFTNGASGIVAIDADGTINTASGNVDAQNATAININGPTGLTNLGMTLTSVSSTNADLGISLQDVSGNFSITGDGTNNGSGGTINAAGSGTNAYGIFVNNSSGAFTLAVSSMNISADFNDASSAGIWVQGNGTANTTVNVQNNTFTNAGGNALYVLLGDSNSTSTANANVTFSNNTIEDLTGDFLGIGGVTIDALGGSNITGQANTATATIQNNTFTNIDATAINLLVSNSGSLTATVTDNNATGIKTGFGIQGLQSLNSTMTVLVDNNIFNGQAGNVGRAIFFDAETTGVVSPTNTGSMNLTITNNQVSGEFDATSLVRARQDSRVCLDLRNNQFTGLEGGADTFTVNMRDASTFQLESFSGVGTNAAAVKAFLTGQNISGTYNVQTTGTGTLVNYTTSSGCTTP